MWRKFWHFIVGIKRYFGFCVNSIVFPVLLFFLTLLMDDFGFRKLVVLFMEFELCKEKKKRHWLLVFGLEWTLFFWLSLFILKVFKLLNQKHVCKSNAKFACISIFTAIPVDACPVLVFMCVCVFPAEDRVQKQQRQHRQRGRHTTSTGQSVDVCPCALSEIFFFFFKAYLDSHVFLLICRHVGLTSQMHSY